MERKPIPYKTFLQESTNLLTCFGILNAFSIISFETKTSIGAIITFAILILSLLVYIELFKFFWISFNGSISYVISMALLLIIFLGLLILTILQFKNEFYILLYVIEDVLIIYFFLNALAKFINVKLHIVILILSTLILIVVSSWITGLIRDKTYSWIIWLSELIERNLDV